MAESAERIKFDENALAREKTRDAPPAAYQRKLSAAEKEAEIASVWSEEPPEYDERDFKSKQVFKGWTLLWLAYQSTGVIYGDIGTSPLYVFSSTFFSEPSHDDLLGALSLIIWSLTLIVTIKYVLVVLCADDEGEGGTFAIYTLLSRFSDIMKRDPRAYHAVRLQRYESNQLQPSNRSIRNWLERSKVAHAILKILAVFGVSLIISDGILTPAQSVLGAIQGIKVVRPDLGSSAVIGISCAILVLLFVAQPLGIGRLASGFAPIVVVWLLFNFCFGIYNLAVHDWTVLKAFSPYFAGLWFVRNGTEGWKSLGGILLCFTGVEALFADLGAFSRRSIQISWLCFAYPSLLLAYIGQAAYISRHPSAYSNPFFNSVPPGMFYPSLVISILAAIVASQALITSTFQLLSQLMHSSYFPHIKMVYTSDKYHGQVFIPIANWLMMIGTVIVAAVFSNTTRLGNAYGVCVILVTFITTNLVTLVALIVWRANPILVFVIWLPFITFDGLYLSAALVKVPDGAWFTILLAALLASFFSLWRFGKEKQWATEAVNTVKLADLIVSAETTAADLQSSAANSSKTYRLTPRYGSAAITPIKGLGIFFDKSGLDAAVPAVYEHFVLKLEAQMSVIILLHLRACPIPHVREEDRYAVHKTKMENVYRLTVRHGYNDKTVSPDLGHFCYEEVRKTIVRGTVGLRPVAVPQPDTAPDTNLAVSAPESVAVAVALPEQAHTLSTSAAASPSDDAPQPTQRTRTAAARVQALDEAYATQTLYLVGKEQLRVAEAAHWANKVLLKAFLFVRENTRAKVAQLDVPVEKLVEVGFVGVI